MNCICNCDPARLVFHEKLAPGLSIQNSDELVDILAGWIGSIAYCTLNNQLTGYQSSYHKSCEHVEIGVN